MNMKLRKFIINGSSRYLQSGCLKSKIDTSDVNLSMLSLRQPNELDSVVTLNYMGHTEYEFDNVDISLYRVTLNLPFYKIIIFNEYTNKDGLPLKVLCPIMYVNFVQDNVKSIINGNAELLGIYDFTKDAEDNNFWWDLENDFMMFYGDETLVLNALEEKHKEVSDDKTLSVLRELYISQIEEHYDLAYKWKNITKKPKIDKKKNTRIYEPFGIHIVKMAYISIILAFLTENNIEYDANGVRFHIPVDVLSQNNYSIEYFDDKTNELCSEYYAIRDNSIKLNNSKKELVLTLKKVLEKKNES